VGRMQPFRSEFRLAAHAPGVAHGFFCVELRLGGLELGYNQFLLAWAGVEASQCVMTGPSLGSRRTASSISVCASGTRLRLKVSATELGMKFATLRI